MTTSWTVPIAIIVAGVIVAGAVYVIVARTQAPDTVGNPALVRPIDSKDHILGNPAARVMIVTYSDFDCEFCKEYHETLHAFIASEGTGGDVAWVYRHFPLSEIHANAESHARAAECAAAAGGNDGFWRFADLLFARQPANPAAYGSLASAAGLGNDFAACLTNISTDITARISADRQNALDIGARGTPYSLLLVEGQPPVVLDGAYPYDALKQFVDQALSQ